MLPCVCPFRRYGVGISSARPLLWMFQNASHHKWATIYEFRMGCYLLGILVPNLLDRLYRCLAAAALALPSPATLDPFPCVGYKASVMMMTTPVSGILPSGYHKLGTLRVGLR